MTAAPATTTSLARPSPTNQSDQLPAKAPQLSRRPIPASIEETSAAKPLSDARHIRPTIWAPVTLTLPILTVFKVASEKA